MNFGKKCPLLILLLVSGLIISGVSLANLDGVYRDYEKKTVMTPVLAAFFQGIREENYPWSSPETEDELVRADEEEELQEALEEGSREASDALGEISGENGETAAADEEAGDDASEKESSFSPEEEMTEHAPETENGEDPEAGQPVQETQTILEEEQAQETEAGSETEGVSGDAQKHEVKVWQLGRVEEDYFEDALFIGDSRTQGLYEYGGFGDNVTFYCKTSLTIYDLFKKNKAFIKDGERKLTLEEALTERSFGKIYLMIGINEMGTGTAESFFEEYARAVFKIQQLQPDAVIFVQAIMRVGAQKNASDPIFNNMNIAIRNVEIETLADDQRIFYIDVNEVLCDENGNLFEGWSNDQVHLKAKYYAVWKEFLLNHGAVENVENG